MSAESIQFNRSFLYGRIRPYESKPAEPQAVRAAAPKNGAIADVQKAAATVKSAPQAHTKAPILTTSSIAPRMSPAAQSKVLRPAMTLEQAVLQEQATRIDFADKAANWRSEYKTQLKAKRAKLLPNYALFAMAAVVFAVGLAASLHSFRVDTKVTAAATARAAAGPTGVDESKPNNLDKYAVSADLPRIIQIPKLGTKARVLQVGLDTKNAVVAPANIHDAGWYTGSAKPGEAGKATLLDGHVSGPTQPGVFKNIGSLQASDSILLEKGDGTTLTYVVVKTEKVAAENVDMQRALTSVTKGKHGLNLISCTGKFDKQTNTFADRVIVYAEQVN